MRSKMQYTLKKQSKKAISMNVGASTNKCLEADNGDQTNKRYDLLRCHNDTTGLYGE